MILCAKYKRGVKVSIGKFLYSAVSIPLDAESTLHFTPSRPVHSNTNLTSLGSVLATLPLPGTPMSIARYIFIQLSGLRHRRENENAQALKR